MRCKCKKEAQLICLKHQLFICLDCEALHRSNNSSCIVEILDQQTPAIERARISEELDKRIQALLDTKITVEKFYFNFHQKLELVKNLLIREMDNMIFIYSSLMSLENLSITLSTEFEKIPKNCLKILRQEVSLGDINAFFKDKFFIIQEKSEIELIQKENQSRKEEKEKNRR